MGSKGIRGRKEKTPKVSVRLSGCHTGESLTLCAHVVSDVVTLVAAGFEHDVETRAAFLQFAWT